MSKFTHDREVFARVPQFLPYGVLGVVLFLLVIDLIYFLLQPLPADQQTIYYDLVVIYQVIEFNVPFTLMLNVGVGLLICFLLITRWRKRRLHTVLYLASLILLIFVVFPLTVRSSLTLLFDGTGSMFQFKHADRVWLENEWYQLA